MTSGTIVQSNIVTMGDCGLNFGGGQDNLITDNVAVNCKVSLNLSSRGVDSFARVNAEKGRDSNQFRLLLRDESLFRGDLWRTRYPRLLAPLEMDPIDAQNAHLNTIRRNVNVGGGALVVRNAKKVMRTCTVEDNVDFFEDPGFVDLASLDLRLRTDASLYAALPDFQAPDFARMGLYDDPGRASPAVKFGPHVSPLSPIMSPEARAEAERPLLVSVPAGDRAIRIDGAVGASEWGTADSQATAVLSVARNGTQEPLPSRVWLRTDEAHLFVAFEHAIAAGKAPTAGSEWGRDDGVEIVLGPARDERLPNRLEAIVLRGYANGTLEVAEGGLSLPSSTKAREAIRYAADGSRKGRWTAELAIPLAAIGLSPGETNFPVFCHVTVRKASADQWITWRRRWSLDPSDAKCACALWLAQFGPLPFMPGIPASAIRIDVQADRSAEKSSMAPGEGADAPDWAVKWNRLVATFGTARADRWKPCRFEFTPLEDATVQLELMGTQSPAGGLLAWTYYDDFRVEGAELVNGDFEEPAQNGRSPGWNCVMEKQSEGAGQDRAAVVELGDQAASGRYAARTSHDHRINQRIAIRKGQKVVVSFQARAALPGM